MLSMTVSSLTFGNNAKDNMNRETPFFRTLKKDRNGKRTQHDRDFSDSPRCVVANRYEFRIQVLTEYRNDFSNGRFDMLEASFCKIAQQSKRTLTDFQARILQHEKQQNYTNVFL